MLGVLVNTLTVALGSALGLLLKKGIPQRVSDGLMKGLALCTLYIGVSSAFASSNTLVMILSMAIGTVIGFLLNLDLRLNNFADKLEKRFQKGEQKVSIAEGFVVASLLFCVGAMTITGSLQAGFGNNETLFAKSVLDFISSIVLASTLGAGVMLAAVFVLVFQGLIVLLAQVAEPFLSAYVIGEMTGVGGLLIIALGLNMIGLTKLKVMNYMPAIFLPILLCWFMK